MRRYWLAFILLCALQLAARADVVRLISGKSYQGAVIAWGTDDVSFVLQGGVMADAFAIPVRLIDAVISSDSTAHHPGTGSWPSSGHLDRLPWEQRRPAAPEADSTELSAGNHLLRLAQLGARADLVRLVSGKAYQGAVIAWGADDISFVLQGGAMKEAFAIPVAQIEYVMLSDSTVHHPGTGSWLSSRHLDRLPWDPPSAAPLDPLSLKNYLLQLALTGAMQTGYTTYQISYPWDSYGDVGESRLDFPLDGYRAGVKALVLSRPSNDRHLQYGVDLDFAWRLSDPRNDMTDSDWARTSSGDYRYVYSATKSTSKASSWELTAAATALYRLGSMLKAGGLLGYHYVHQSYDIYGVTGWQDPTFITSGVAGDKYYFDVLRDTRVLQYTVSYKLPMLGLVLLSETNEGLSLQARGAYLFSATADDEDLHLLRNKKGTCSASGSGWQLGGDAWVRIARLRNRSTIALGGSYDYLTVSTQGYQTQVYYGDDPGIPGVQTGLRATGIDDKLSLYRHSFSVFATYTF